MIKAEFEFFNSYKNELNEQIIFVDKNFNYIVYNFIKNGNKTFNEKNLILKIKQYIDSYPNFAGDGFGFLFEEKNLGVNF